MNKTVENLVRSRLKRLYTLRDNTAADLKLARASVEEGERDLADIVTEIDALEESLPKVAE